MLTLKAFIHTCKGITINAFHKRGNRYTLKTPLPKGIYIIESSGCGSITDIQPVAIANITPLKPLSLKKRFFYSKHPINDLTFCHKCNTTTKPVHLKLRRVTFNFAEKRLLRKICNKHDQYQHYTPRQLKTSLKTIAASKTAYKDALFALYNAVYRPCNTINDDYDIWLHHNQIDNKIAVLPNGPQDKLPILCYLSRANLSCLTGFMNSLDKQSNPYWELYLLAPGFDNNELTQYLYTRLTNQPIQLISSTSDPAFISATHQQHCLLITVSTHLHSSAIANFRHTLQQQPDSVVIYSDHDHVNTQKRHHSPVFKPAFDPVLLTQTNYIGSAFVIQSRYVQQGFSFNDFDDGLHNLLLRCLLDKTVHDKVVAVPEVLLHNYNPNPAPLNPTAILKVVNQGEQCHSIRKGLLPNCLKITENLDHEPLISIIIPIRDKVSLLKQALDSLFTLTSYKTYEVIVVNNDSTEAETRQYLGELQTHTHVRVLDFSGAFNFSAINNFAADQACGEFLCLLNSDIKVIHPEWLTELYQLAKRDDTGCVGAKLYYENDTIQHAGVIMGHKGVSSHGFSFAKRDDEGYMGLLKLTRRVSAVTGACLMVRKAIYEAVGGLNATDLKVSFNDIDFCLKVARAGYHNLWTPYAELYHLESLSRGGNDTAAKRAQFNREKHYMLKHWPSAIAADPYYNKNLSRSGQSYSLPCVNHDADNVPTAKKPSARRIPP